MRLVKLIFLAVLAVVLVVVALANSALVTLRVLPETMAGFLGWSWQITLPMFAVIVGGLIVGLLIGFTWEFLREHKHRSAARQERREKEALKRENDKLRTDRRGNRANDDVLALLEDGSVPR